MSKQKEEPIGSKIGFSLGVRKSNTPFPATNSDPLKQTTDNPNNSNNTKQDGEEK